MGLFNVRYRMEDPFFDAACVAGSNRNSKEPGRQRGVDLIHVAQEFAELLRAVASLSLGADRNACGGGPTRETYPMPRVSAIARVETRPGMDIPNIDKLVV